MAALRVARRRLVESPPMKCPSCGAQTPDAAPECATCGVIVAKALEKKEREKRLAEEFLARGEVPPPKAPNLWIGRAIAVLIVVLWFGALFVYYVKVRHEAAMRADPTLRLVPVGRP